MLSRTKPPKSSQRAAVPCSETSSRRENENLTVEEIKWRFSRSNRVQRYEGSNVCSDPGNLCSRAGRFLSGATRRLDAVNVRSILNSNQFQIVRRKDFSFRVLHFQSRGFPGAFVQNLKTFLSA